MTITEYQSTLVLNGSADAVRQALTTAEGITAWWTRTTGSGEAGGELRLFFTGPEPLVVRVDEATCTSVRWTVTSCDFLPDWVGTRPTFTLAPDGDAVELRFVHHGLTSELECIEDCTRGWDFFLQSLKQHVDSGRGTPVGSAADAARRR